MPQTEMSSGRADERLEGVSRKGKWQICLFQATVDTWQGSESVSSVVVGIDSAVCLL